MNVTIPIYVQSHRDEFTVRPLFFTHPVQRHEKLERVLHLLAGELRRELRELGKQLRHDALAAWTFCPELDYHRLDLLIELRKRNARGRFFFAVFDTLGRRVAFTPSVPDLWFELARGESLLERATEVLTAYFRQREKEDEDNFLTPESHALAGTAWVTTIDLDIYPAQTIKPSDEDKRASLGGDDGDPDGERELFGIGRCLDQLYPDDLDRVLLRDPEVDELTRLLQSSDRRPVLLLGPPLTGKTALLHEYVWRTVSRRKEPHKIVNYTWLLSPPRLISGMSYVGQWEKRLLAILKEADKKDHILYFDDFLGLYYAGRTSQSDLCAADVMKPYVERREVRLLAEMTPEAFRVLRERDRGFADLVHVLPLHEPPARDVLRILIAVQRQLEASHRCRFGLDVLTSVLDLQRRYVRHLSFPGKAALFQRRLAVKFRRQDIGREQVLAEFHAQSGLSLNFLDSREKLAAADVVKRMENQVIGQPQALTACAEVVSIAKARLNDPERPLAAFLFLGPTGVGKTQCAKALAEYLFGDAEKMLRFDMNEFTEPGSSARLVGTFFQPEGLLTAAIRRQPFAVVLFDEIEKADPEVFDLLLQVLGEGRLTDALGRTAEFCNAILILTSNLGVREASATAGYGGDGHNRDAYAAAAQRFFRPEFFNRLDRIVAFERLTRADVGRIAHLLLAGLFQREGLVRRKCLLRVEGGALERIIDQGFDPVLGARALKRSLERQLAQPVAARLAAGIPEGLTAIHVYPLGNALGVDVRTVEQVAALPPRDAANALLANRAVFLERARAALRRIEDRFEPMRPHGPITAATLEGEHLLYFTIHEYLHGLRERLQAMEDRLDAEKRAALTLSGYAVAPIVRARKTSNLRPSKIDDKELGGVLRGLAAAQDIRLFLEDLVSGAAPETSHAEWTDPLGDLALAELVADCCLNPRPERVLLYCSPVGGEKDLWTRRLLRTLGVALKSTQGGECENLNIPEGMPGYALVARGTIVWELAKLEEGTHLVFPQHGSTLAVQMHVWPLPENADPLELLEKRLELRRAWQERLSRGEAAIEDDPLPLQPVLRIYDESGTVIDLRTGMSDRTQTLLLPFLLAALPLPPELVTETS